MTLYLVRIPKQDEQGEYLEDHYFKDSYKATLFAMENGIENFSIVNLNKDLADKIAE